MTANMTNEEIVTKLLASNEIITNKPKNFKFTNPIKTLGKYLSDIKKTSTKNEVEVSKYIFIKQLKTPF